MNWFCLFLISLFISLNVCAQKPVLNNLSDTAFPVVTRPIISNDGRYVFFSIGKTNKSFSAFIKSVDGKFTKDIANLRLAPAADFSTDSRWLIVKTSGDSLLQFDLRLGKETILPFCKSYKVPSKGNGHWIAYQLTNNQLFFAKYDIW